MAEKDDGYLRFFCKACGRTLKVKRSREGGDVVPCPACGAQVNVPLVNLEEIAKAGALAETGDPGRINVNPELLMRRLTEETVGKGAATRGGAPTLREGKWAAQTAVSRVIELEQVAAALLKIDQDAMGQMLRFYRQRDLTPEQREQHVKDLADHRSEEVRQLFVNRVAGLDRQVKSLEPRRERLGRSELEELERLKNAREAVEFYARYVLGVRL